MYFVEAWNWNSDAERRYGAWTTPRQAVAFARRYRKTAKRLGMNVTVHARYVPGRTWLDRWVYPGGYAYSRSL